MPSRRAAPALLSSAALRARRISFRSSLSTAGSSVSVSSASFDSLSGNSLDTEVGTTFSWIDNLTLVRGRHTLKFGVNIMRVRLNNSGNTLTTSSLAYASADDFINNKASSATYLQGEGVVGNRRAFYQGDYPASTLVEIQGLARPEFLVEIEVIAAVAR